MATEKEEKKITEQEVENPTPKPQKKTTKFVRNRSGHRVELVIDGKVVVFLPGKTTEIPIDVGVPNGLGLYVR